MQLDGLRGHEEPLGDVAEQTFEGPQFDESFAIDVSLPKGKVPFNARVSSEVGPILSDGSTVSEASAPGKLPIVGGARTPTDTTPPVLSVPGLQVIDATGPQGATVTYAASASDDSGARPAVQCTPASGTVFPIGLTQVSCTAADAVGNQATATFSVRVNGASEQLAALIARVTRLPEAVRANLVAASGAAPKPVQCAGLRTFTVLVRRAAPPRAHPGRRRGGPDRAGRPLARRARLLRVGVAK